MDQTHSLKRALTLPHLILYGLGTMLGAGVYVLIGKVAAESGLLTPIAFLLAGILAALTAFSYAELSARLPKSAGEVTFIFEATKSPSLSTFIGVLVFITGIVSAATMIHGLAGYTAVFLNQSPTTIIVVTTLLLGLVTVWGINESVILVGISTVASVVGLLVIGYVVGGNPIDTTQRWLQALQTHATFNFGTSFGVLMGAFLAFYAYIGFEDLANVAEEVINPTQNMPRAIVISMAIATLLYVGTAIVIVTNAPLDQLEKSAAPMAVVLQDKSSYYSKFVSVMGIFAVINGALVQIIMGSRIIYGMAGHGFMPKFFRYVLPRKRTPIISTLFTTLVILTLALWFPVLTLATITSFVILLVFALVDLSLVMMKLRDPHPKNVVRYPTWIPASGFLLSFSFLVFKLYHVAITHL